MCKVTVTHTCFETDFVPPHAHASRCEQVVQQLHMRQVGVDSVGQECVELGVLSGQTLDIATREEGVLHHVTPAHNNIACIMNDIMIAR